MRELFLARSRAHAAHHAERAYEPRAVTPRDILRRIKTRLQARVTHEHARAKHAATDLGRSGAMAAFQAQWLTTGLAAATRRGPQLLLLGATPPVRPPAAGSVHVRVVGELVPASTRSAPSAGFAISAHDVAGDGSESLRLRAHGAVMAEATHSTKAPPLAPRLHSVQAAVQTGLGRALQYARQLTRKGETVVISLSNATAVRDVTREVAASGASAAPGAVPADGEARPAKRQRGNGATAPERRGTPCIRRRGSR